MASTLPDNPAGLTVRLRGEEPLVSFSVEIVDDEGNRFRDALVCTGDGRLWPTWAPYLILTEAGGQPCAMALLPIGRDLLVHDEDGRCAEVGHTLTATGFFLRETGALFAR